MDKVELSGHYHFILEWYDEIAEVICQELIFGSGEFDLATQLAQDGRFAVAYLRRAEAAERQGQLADAISDLERYITMAPDPTTTEYAKRRLEHLRPLV